MRQKRLAVKEDIRFFADENEQRGALPHQSAVADGARRHATTSTTPTGEKIGVLEKVFSEIPVPLDVAHPRRERAGGRRSPRSARSRSPSCAAPLDFIPYADFVPIPFHFTIDAGDRHLGDLNRRLGYRDTYDLDLSGDPDRTIDRRLAIALGVALDALQSR